MTEPPARKPSPSAPLDCAPVPRDHGFSAERTADVAAHIDDPCDEGGYDQFCRDRNGQLCAFHEEHCHAPHYPCLDLLRHHLAVVFLEDVSQRRQARQAMADEKKDASSSD